MCEPNLDVNRRYGLEHRKALQMVGARRVKFLGMSVGLRPAFKSMAAPTTRSSTSAASPLDRPDR